MEDHLYRPKQELDRIGPVYSTKDEKQRVLAKEILDLKIRPELAIKVNLNIPGLDKKKVYGSKNPATFLFYKPLTMTGKKGTKFIFFTHNINRFFIPFFIVLFYWYNCESYIRGSWYDKEMNNCESESSYFKLQTFNCHFPEKSSLMT